jgi:hypothetical protein
VYHCFAFSVREKGNNSHLRASCVMPEMLRHEHISSNSYRWLQGSSFSRPEKVCARTMATKLGWSSQPDERFGFEGGSGNSSFEAVRFWIGAGFKVTKKKGIAILFLWKELIKETRTH